MKFEAILDQVGKLKEAARDLASDAGTLEGAARQMADQAAVQGTDPVVMGLTVFVLAIFVGYYVVWKVTPALHSPLMAVTNAISSVIIVGALIAAGPGVGISSTLGFVAVMLASVNIFGGFMITHRMLEMFSAKKK